MDPYDLPSAAPCAALDRIEQEAVLLTVSEHARTTDRATTDVRAEQDRCGAPAPRNTFRNA